MKKKELVEKLKLAGSVSSNVFIPVSDVISMVEELETEPSSPEMFEDIINDIAVEIAHQLDRMGKDVISGCDIEADVSGNTIEVSISDISFDRYELESIVEEAIEKFVSKKVQDDQEENNQ